MCVGGKEGGGERGYCSKIKIKIILKTVIFRSKTIFRLFHKFLAPFLVVVGKMPHLKTHVA